MKLTLIPIIIVIITSTFIITIIVNLIVIISTIIINLPPNIIIIISTLTSICLAL
jgi:hypothetical protein